MLTARQVEVGLNSSAQAGSKVYPVPLHHASDVQAGQMQHPAPDSPADKKHLCFVKPEGMMAANMIASGRKSGRNLQHAADTVLQQGQVQEGQPADGSADQLAGGPSNCHDSKQPDNWSNWQQWRLPVILPSDRRYKIWWMFTMCTAIITSALDPYRLSFADGAGWYPYNDAWAMIEYLTMVIFAADIGTKFLLAYNCPIVGLETRHSRIAWAYFRGLFWVDLITTFPIDGVSALALGLQSRAHSELALWLGLVRWLRLARLYRIFVFFQQLERALQSQVTLILARDLLYVLYTTHWMACLVHWTGLIEELKGIPSWMDRAPERWEGQGAGVRYLYSLYFSVGAFAGLGDNDFYVASPAESMILILYLMFNIVLQAYILGTITMVLVKGDERQRLHRDRLEALRAFSDTNALPDHLSTAMREHLELMNVRDQLTDEQVLVDYPPMLKRKALRHLYGPCLSQCLLFQNVKGRFLDQLLSCCKAEVYMPNVVLMNEGDTVSELMIVLEGQLQGVPAGEHLDLGQQLKRSKTAANNDVEEMTKTFAFASAAKRRRSVALYGSFARNTSMQSIQSAHNASNRRSAVGSTYSQNACDKSLRESACRMSAFDVESPSLFNRQSSLMHGDRIRGGAHGLRTSSGPAIANLPNVNEATYCRSSTGQMAGGSQRRALSGRAASDHTSLFSGREYLEYDMFGAVPFFTDTPSLETVYTTSITRVLVITRSAYDTLAASHPEQVRALLESLREMSEQDLLDELHEAADIAAALGRIQTTQHLKAAVAALNHSFTSSKTAHSGKQGSERAASKLDVEAHIQQLEQAGLPLQQQQQLRQLATLHKTVSDFMRKQKAVRLYEFLLAASQGDLGTMRELLQQGVKPGWADYDGRTALMVAAHEGQDAAVRLLLTHEAPLAVTDAHGNTALSEAVLQGHDHVIQLLIAAGAPLGWNAIKGSAVLCQAILGGDIAGLRRMLLAGADANWAGIDGWTALHVAASEGNLAAVEMLIGLGQAAADVPNRQGKTPVDEAKAAGHHQVVEVLEPLLTEVLQGTRPSWRQLAAQKSVEQGRPLGSKASNSVGGANSNSPRHRRLSACSTIAPCRGIGAYRPHDISDEEGTGGLLCETPYMNLGVQVMRDSLEEERPGDKRTTPETAMLQANIGPMMPASSSQDVQHDVQKPVQVPEGLGTPTTPPTRFHSSGLAQSAGIAALACPSHLKDVSQPSLNTGGKMLDVERNTEPSLKADGPAFHTRLQPPVQPTPVPTLDFSGLDRLRPDPSDNVNRHGSVGGSHGHSNAMPAFVSERVDRGQQSGRHNNNVGQSWSASDRVSMPALTVNNTLQSNSALPAVAAGQAAAKLQSRTPSRLIGGIGRGRLA